MHTAASLTQKLDELFKPWDRNDAPGLAVGIAHKGEVIYRRGIGLASVEHATPNSPAMRMRIGSTSKHFTAFGIMLLAEEGKLDIHQPLRSYLPELTGIAGTPTLLQLMHHTGGLRDPMFISFFLNHGNFGHLAAGASLDLMARSQALNFAPGERMAYSNSGYTMLSLVIERISGQTYEQFFSQRVFAPLGMNDTTLLRNDLDIVPNMATAHMPQAGGRWRRGVYPTDELLGSGGIISTVDNMLAWAAHLRAPRKTVGSAETWAKMLEPQTGRSGTPNSYALGIVVDQHRGIDIIHHSGATFGTQSQMIAAPQHELDIVILANRGDIPVPNLALIVLEAILAEHLAPARVPPPASEFPLVQGRWYSAQSRTLMQISARKLKPELPELLLLSLYNTPTSVLFRRGDGLAMPDGPMSSFEIRKPPQGAAPPASLDVHIAGDLERFERLPDTPPTAAELAPAVTGRYRYAEFGKELEIIFKDGKLFIDFLPGVGQTRWELEPFSADVFGCGHIHSVPAMPLPVLASINLERRDGKVLGFWLNTDRVRQVRFDRC